MAVRFLPPPGGDASPPGGDRTDLAEVIELRSLLSHAKWRVPGSTGDEPAGESAGGDESAASGDESAASGDPSVISAVGTPKRSAVDASEPSNVVRADFGRAAERAEPAATAAAELDEPAATLPAEGAESADDFDASEASALGPERSANEDGVRLLARKARSSGELREELLRLGHDAYEVETVVEEFERSLYLDDVGLARVLTEKLREAKRASRAQIRTKLRARKLADAAIEAALDELDDEDEIALLRRAAADRARTLRDLDRPTAERRLLGFLARRGWSGEPAMRAVREALDAAAPRPRGGGSGVRFR
ncbi:RecX family transcriptional regulator [Leucobacter rhizosphaerae]|uniref:Regulatory protein RecX n=1 Tax=Leucobacter rhizosphaerae TaxID=2932245 RepID=A0ABY4FW78_9MICO|nr:RecX family transcriptional regulator [Leucobacter rhizosphaerae]UOQ60518.1 RecX family transcriptional regulator [Leucobacter rhizosphaerae]